MRKGLMILMAVLICIVSLGAERNEPFRANIAWEEQGFEKMYATAYCVGHHTANGDAVYEGGCASSLDHIGDVAIVYTLEGEFLGYFYCNDTGKEGGGVRNGDVLDIYRSDLDRCQELMETIGKEQKVYVKWVKGKG